LLTIDRIHGAMVDDRQRVRHWRSAHGAVGLP
jgi:hypothetical protein